MEENVRENKMGTMPIGKLLANMAGPVMISMLFQALYNIVDSVFVARLSQDAMNAVSLAFPLQTLCIAFAVGTGVGMNALLARSLGEKNMQAVDRAAGTGLFLTLCTAAVFAVLGFSLATPFFRFQTENAQIIAYGSDYVMICIGGQLQGKGTVFAGLHRDGQIGHTALDAFQRSFALHRHIFVEGALAMDGIQLPHGGLNNAPILDVQLPGADGLPEPLAALRLILGVRPGLQPCRHDPAAIRGKGGLGGVEVDAAVHQLHIFFREGVGGFVVAADEGNHVVTIVELALGQHLHGSQHQDLLAIQREEVRALPHFAVLIVAAFQHRDKVPVEAVLALEHNERQPLPSSARQTVTAE